MKIRIKYPKLTAGKKQYNDLYFKTVDMIDEYKGYNQIIFLAYRITQDDKEAAKDNPNKISNTITKIRSDDLPDFDIETGNIHPSKKRIKDELNDNKEYKYKQIVLAKTRPGKHAGPNNIVNDGSYPRVKIGKDVNCKYEDLDKFKLCYYPPLEKNGEYDPVLKEFWDSIPEELKIDD